MAMIDDARGEMALQGRIHLLLDCRPILKFVQVVAEIIDRGHSSELLGRMLNAVVMARRPQQHLVEGLRLALPLHGHRQMSFQAL